MGKIKTKRAPLHGKAVQVPNAEIEKKSQTPSKGSTPAGSFARNPKLDGIFTKLDIDLNALSRQLPGKDFDDTKSGITSKSLKGMNLKKNEKQKLRHEFFMKKIDTIQHTKKQAKARKKREKTAVVGDMQKLADTLPTLDLLLRDVGKPRDSQSKQIHKANLAKQKAKGIKKEFSRKKQMKDDISTFHQVMQFPTYKSNPTSTIAEHLRNKLKQEDAMDT